jgi:excisionase family DNA binding protein
MESIMLTVDEAAKFLNVPKKTIYILTTKKGFPASKFGGKQWRIHNEKLARWAEIQCR